VGTWTQRCIFRYILDHYISFDDWGSSSVELARYSCQNTGRSLDPGGKKGNHMLKAIWQALLEIPRPLRGGLVGGCLCVLFLSLLMLIPWLTTALEQVSKDRRRGSPSTPGHRTNLYKKE